MQRLQACIQYLVAAGDLMHGSSVRSYDGDLSRCWGDEEWKGQVPTSTLRATLDGWTSIEKQGYFLFAELLHNGWPAC